MRQVISWQHGVLANYSGTLNAVLDRAADSESLQGCRKGGRWLQGQVNMPFSVRSFMDVRGVSTKIQW